LFLHIFLTSQDARKNKAATASQNYNRLYTGRDTVNTQLDTQHKNKTLFPIVTVLATNQFH